VIFEMPRRVERLAVNRYCFMDGHTGTDGICSSSIANVRC
jgi:hypothetical protein